MKRHNVKSTQQQLSQHVYAETFIEIDFLRRRRQPFCIFYTLSSLAILSVFGTFLNFS